MMDQPPEPGPCEHCGNDNRFAYACENTVTGQRARYGCCLKYAREMFPDPPRIPLYIPTIPPPSLLPWARA